MEGRENGEKMGFLYVWNSRKVREKRKLTIDPTKKVFIAEVKRKRGKVVYIAKLHIYPYKFIISL